MESFSGVLLRLQRACVLPILAAASLFGLGACADLTWLRGEAAPVDATSAARGGNGGYDQGKIELASGRYGLAVRHFMTALERSPDSIDALNGLGAAFDRLGRFDLSARAYGRALTLDPDAVQTLNNLGYSFFLQGRYDLAVAYLRDAASRPGASALTIANRRLAETALARARGPAPKGARPAALTAPKTSGATFKPRIRRAGKAVRELVTQPPETAGPGPAAVRSFADQGAPGERHSHTEDLLPAFVAAPMVTEEPWTRAPALSAARRPWPSKGVSNRP